MSLAQQLKTCSSREELETLMTELTIEATQKGLSPEDLDVVVRSVVGSSSSKLITQAIQHRLVHLLVPKRPILSSTVIRIASSLGIAPNTMVPQKPSVRVQIALLKWLCTVHPFLQDGQILNTLYTVLFNYLSYETLRPYLCSLLFISTTDAAVQSWRYDTLLQIKNKNRDPRTSGYVDSLLNLYSHFKPHLHPPADMKWSEKRVSTVPPDDQLLGNILRVFGNANTPLLYQNTARLTDIVDAIDKPMPKQIPEVVGNSHLARIFHLKASQLDDQRLNRWLTANMDERKVLQYMEYTKEMPVAVVNHLVKVVRDTADLSTTTWTLLSKLPILSPITLRNAFLLPLKHSPTLLVDCLGKLLCHWKTLDCDDQDGPIRDVCSREIHSSALQLCSKVSLSVSLRYFEQAALFTATTSPSRSLTPSLPLVQLYIASADPGVVSRLAQVLFTLRNSSLASEAYKSAVLELSNAVWSSRRPNMPQEYLNKLAGLLRFPVTVDNVFGMSMSPALSHIAAVYLWKLEDAPAAGILAKRHEGPVSAQSLADNRLRGGLDLTIQQYKEGLLEFAASEYSLVGMEKFFYATMKSLQQKRSAEVEADAEKRRKIV